MLVIRKMSLTKKFLQQNTQLGKGSSRVYEKVLVDLAKFAGPTRDIDDLTEDEVIEFLEKPATKFHGSGANKKLVATPKAAATFNLYLVIVKAYYTFIGKKYCKKMKPKKVKAKSLDITAEHVEWLRQSCRNARDECLIAVLANYGLRIGEAAALCLKHIEPHPSGTGYYITVPGLEGCKTGTRRVFNVACDALIGTWLLKHPDPKNSEARLFCNLRGKKVARRYLQNTFLYVEQRARKVHPEMPHIHPHMLRHLCITQWNKRGLNTTLIMQLSGHRTLEMVEHYCHLTNADANAAIERLSGIKTEEAQQPINCICPKCKRSNLPGAVVCSFCMSPMNIKVALDMEAKRVDLFTKFSMMVAEHPDLAELVAALQKTPK